MSLKEDMRIRLSARLRWPISRHFPQGVHIGRDLDRFFPNYAMENILDVGAHHGESAIEYSILFPNARIDSFEPMPATFRELEEKTRKVPQVFCHNYGLGAENLDVKMDTTADHSSMYKISEFGTESVKIKTAQEFCRLRGISRVSFLKVDTEGFDMEVLRGAEPLIARSGIDFIEVEAGMNPENSAHIYFANFTQFLYPYGYRIFGIYEQGPEGPSNSAKLRRANVVFMSPSLT